MAKGFAWSGGGDAGSGAAGVRQAPSRATPRTIVPARTRLYQCELQDKVLFCVSHCLARTAHEKFAEDAACLRLLVV